MYIFRAIILLIAGALPLFQLADTYYVSEKEFVAHERYQREAFTQLDARILALEASQVGTVQRLSAIEAKVEGAIYLLGALTISILLLVLETFLRMLRQAREDRSLRGRGNAN